VITVISTGFAHKTKEKCLASVAEQRGVLLQHIYVEASEQAHPKSALENFYDVCIGLPSDRIVACLDGDDWLAHDRALARVQAIYDDKPDTLVTYGQFSLAWPFGPTPGCSDHRAPPRRDVWRASHLKTFRAGMFQRIKKQDLFFEGAFMTHTCDLAVMIPILEMAGPDRTFFNREVICIYNTDHAQAQARVRWEMDRAHAIDAHIRSLPPYERIDSL
jgi:hypothetical protein